MSTTLVPFQRKEAGLASLGANGGPVEPSSEILKKALGTAVAPPTDIGGLQKLRDELVSEKYSCLPVEVSLLAKLEQEIAAVEEALTSAKVNDKRRTPLSHLDFDVLSWRHKDSIGGVPVPKLALINVQAGNTATFRSNWVGGDHRKLSDDVAYKEPETSTAGQLHAAYQDVHSGLRNRLSRITNSATLGYSFEGAIPKDIRSLIKEAQRAFPAVYLLADAPFDGWRFSSTHETRAERAAKRRAARAEMMRHLDPLVLGYGGKKLWVLGAFDATEIEQYIKAEFTR